jgi:hypothetical protein
MKQSDREDHRSKSLQKQANSRFLMFQAMYFCIFQPETSIYNLVLMFIDFEKDCSSLLLGFPTGTLTAQDFQLSSRRN